MQRSGKAEVRGSTLGLRWRRAVRSFNRVDGNGLQFAATDPEHQHGQSRNKTRMVGTGGSIADVVEVLLHATDLVLNRFAPEEPACEVKWLYAS